MALLANQWISDGDPVVVVLPGVAVALALVVAAYAFQRWRYRVFERSELPSAPVDPPVES